MSSRVLVVLLLVVLGTAAAVVWMSGEDSRDIEELPQVTLVPEVPGLDVDLNNSFIERLIVEDEEIQAALRGETLISEATGEVESEEPEKTNADILFEQMAPWVYVNYRKINDVESARFLNTNTQRKSAWLRVGGTLSGAKIESLDREKAVVRFADATQELYYVPEKPTPFDPTVPRTPEQIAEAQLRYREFYMKKFIVSGKEYARRRGRRSNAEVPPRDVQIQSAREYLNLAEKLAEKSQGAPLPPEALIDVGKLDPEQRKVYERYRALFGRSPEDITNAIREHENALESELQRLQGGTVEGTESDDSSGQ